MVELVDTYVSEAYGAILEGSSPSSDTMKIGVYILFSEKDKKTYVGSTNDIDRRLFEHRNGKVTSTKNRLPLKLLSFEEFTNLSEARKKEHYYKSCSGRKKMKLLFNTVQVPRLDSQSRSRREAGPSDT